MKRSASLLILNPQGKLLLLERSGESRHFQGDWEFPGGKIDAGESPQQAVVREVREESGLLAEIPIGEPLWRTVTANASVEYSFFVWKPTNTELNIILSGEHQDFKWVSFTEARKMRMMQPHREFMDRYWLQEQVKVYRKELPRYVGYKIFLEAVLNRLRSRWAPLAIVQAREKGLSSFSEKCVRKADKYDDPAHELTDLCGARIIATTTHEVDTLIRQIQKLFAVDELDDTSRRHDIAEFGYLSVHFIVHVPEGATTILGISVPSEIGGRKAEIQVRTMLQHAHSEVTHDRLYKSGFTAPMLRRREAARVAATLESADDQFARFVNQLDAYVGHYAAHLPPEKRRKELDDLKLVLEQEQAPDKKAALALRITRLARAASDWAEVIRYGEPYIEPASSVSECLRMEVGHALCQLHQEKPTGADFRRGLDLLRNVAQLESPADGCMECAERDRRATALAWLGWANSRVPGHRSTARNCLEKAVELAPDNPYHLTSFVELDVIASGTDGHVSLLAPSLRQAAGRCEEHLRAAIEGTRAWLTLAKLRFLLNDPFSSFEALCLGARAAETHYPLAAVVHSFEQFKDAIGARRPSVDWICAGAQLLARAKERSVQTTNAREREPLAERHPFDASLPVTIFAGATADAESIRIQTHEPLILDGLLGYHGFVISGGTTAGVCGLIARAATQLNSSNRAAIQLVGYVPENLPNGATINPAFSALIRTQNTHDFSILEPIQMWADLLASGVDPKNVRLFCLGGGELSAMELGLACALGAKAAVVNDASTAARRFASLLNWAGGQTDSGMMLPDDPATLTAFFAFDAAIDPKQWEKSGEAVHRAYVKSQQKGTKQPNLLPWPLLRDDFKHSNRHQAACSVEILRRCGFVVEPSSLPREEITLTEFSKVQIEQLAEWEHGRWNVERLKAGWRFGEKKDETRKVSPYLVSWHDLPDAIKNYDRAAVRDWPAILAQAGWHIKQP
jgi:mutator protein MutT